jgi:YesN/AraC family two-component response regulator
MEIMRKDHFDAVLLDIQMPGMSGLDVLAKFQQEHPKSTTAFFAITADPEPSMVTKLVSAGFVEVIPKPFTGKTLRHALQSLLASMPEKRYSEQNKCVTASSSDKAYQRDELLDLADGNRDFQVNMLDLFVRNTDENLEKLKYEIQNNNFDEVAALAHKAIPPCRHLKINGMVEKLKLIELTSKQQLEEIPAMNYEALAYEWRSIRELLLGEITQIKGEAGRDQPASSREINRN